MEKIRRQKNSWNVIDWNKNAIDFYENRGAKIVDGWSIVHLSGIILKIISNKFNTEILNLIPTRNIFIYFFVFVCNF